MEIYPISNDVVFCAVMVRNPDLAKELIETILNIRIDHLALVDAQHVANQSVENKSVRFDVFVKDDQGTRYDVEMQTTNNRFLPNRIRYYQAANTVESVSRGDEYEGLPQSYVIFICTLDPFKKGDAVYTFRTMSEKYHEGLDYNDGAYTYVLNAASDDLSISPKLHRLLKYVKTGIPADDGFTEKLQEQVIEVNKIDYWRSKMATLEDRDFDRKVDIAMKLLSAGIDAETVVNCTDLKAKTVAKLKEDTDKYPVKPTESNSDEKKQLEMLARYMEKRKKEREIQMLRTEYDQKAYAKSLYDDGKAEGIAEGTARGKAEGIAVGKAEGDKARARKTALLMIQDGEEKAKIQRYTGLSMDQITELMMGSKQ